MSNASGTISETDGLATGSPDLPPARPAIGWQMALSYDFYARRIVHPIYVIGTIGMLILSQRGFVARTDTWQSIAGPLATGITYSGIGSALGRFPL